MLRRVPELAEPACQQGEGESAKLEGPRDPRTLGCRPVPQPATSLPVVTHCCFCFILSGPFPQSNISWVSVPAPTPSAPLPFLSLCLFLFPALLMSPTCIKVTAARGLTPNTLDLPLYPLPYLEACTYAGSRRHPPALSVSQASGFLLVGVHCLAGVSEAAWGKGSNCLIQRTIPCTRSDGWLCSGITNREMKGMLHSHSGKIKCARTNHF